MDIIIVSFLVLVTLGLGYIIFVLSGKQDPSETTHVAELIDAMAQKNERVVKEEMSTNRKEVGESEKRMREELIGLFKSFGEPVERRMSVLATTQNTNFE